jgi:cytochrome P450 family 6
MGLIFESTLLDVGAVAAFVLSVIYIYFRKSFRYWKEKKAPYIKPTFPFGNFGDLVFLRKSLGHLYAELYKKLDGEKYGGIYMFTKPQLIFRDPDIIKDVLVKDFSSFHDRGVYVNEKLEPLSANLAFLNGKSWRNLRVKLTPTFTSGKLKMMFQTLADCGQELGIILEDTARNEETIEIKDILARYSTDIISSCAFGIESNSLKNPNAEFRQWGRKVFQTSIKLSTIRTLTLLMPSLVSALKLRDTDPEVSKYFRKMFQETMKFREKNNVKRNDFMQLLIQLKNQGNIGEKPNDLEQNGHGNVNNKPGGSGTYLPYQFHKP